ncbi:GFA family protein [Enterococcus casseliflavus]|nr:GFA family protein [Enterococcus casseliflavus]
MCRKWGSDRFFLFQQEAVKTSPSLLRNQLQDTNPLIGQREGFCRNCGSNLFYYLIPTDSYDIPIDLFTDESESCLKLEIYYDQKPHYYDFANETDIKTEDEIMLGIQEKFFD